MGAPMGAPPLALDPLILVTPDLRPQGIGGVFTLRGFVGPVDLLRRVGSRSGLLNPGPGLTAPLDSRHFPGGLRHRAECPAGPTSGNARGANGGAHCSRSREGPGMDVKMTRVGGETIPS
jgi:hypothetical protein